MERSGRLTQRSTSPDGRWTAVPVDSVVDRGWLLMDVAELVRRHYGGDDLEAGIVAGLTGAGADPANLTVADLSAVDQLHAGFSEATRHLLAQLDLSAESHLLDVGCGIGGPARMAAAEYGCAVIGVDLSPEFIAAAQGLTARVGLAASVDFRLSAGEQLDFATGTFDRAMMVHVGMNIPDKAAVFNEVRRVLGPGGSFAVYEQMRVAPGELTYPLPWAEDSRSSFVESPADYVAALEQAGFRIGRTEDRTAVTAAPVGPPPRLSPAAIFGPRFVERIGNNIAATRAGLLAAVLIIAHTD